MPKKVLIFVTSLLCGLALEASADQFSTAISVNGVGISHYEIDQRERLLRALQSTGDLKRQAEEALIHEQLFLQAAERNGVTVEGHEVYAGITEYASRANVTQERFIDEIARFGVDEQSLIAFIHAGVAWRKLVQSRFSRFAQQVTGDDIDDRLKLRPAPRTTRVNLLELAILSRPGLETIARQTVQDIISTVRSSDDFMDAARTLSAADSRNDGGDIGWIPLDRLPAASRDRIRNAPNGTIVGPFDFQGAAFLFFKKGMREELVNTPAIAIEYATLVVPPQGNTPAGSVANALRYRVDSCNDLLFESRLYPRGNFKQEVLPPDHGEHQYSAPLDQLDEGEIAFLPSSNDSVTLLMLCKRLVAGIDNERRASILNDLRTQQLQAHSRVLLSQLRDSAIIIRQ